MRGLIALTGTVLTILGVIAVLCAAGGWVFVGLVGVVLLWVDSHLERRAEQRAHANDRPWEL